MSFNIYFNINTLFYTEKKSFFLWKLINNQWGASSLLVHLTRGADTNGYLRVTFREVESKGKAEGRIRGW